MSIKRVSLLALLVASLLLLALATVGGTAAQEKLPQDTKETRADVDTAFTYQGELQDGGSPADGSYDFRFSLHDAQAGGAQVRSTVAVNNVIVTDGLFSVALDFGNLFYGAALWLEIDIREGGSAGPYTTLSPRQALAAAPYALGLRPGAVISGTVGLGVLHLRSNADGLRVDSAGDDGVYVGQTGDVGVLVDSAGSDGVDVSSAGYIGVGVGSAGLDGVFIGSAGDDGLEVWSASGNGVEIVLVDNNGLDVWSAGLDGVYIDSTGDDGLEVFSAGNDGVVVLEAADDGVYVDTAGDKGVAVLFAGGNGVYANTTQTSGEWGMRTPDKITASNVTFSSLALIVQVAGPEPLYPGDLVAAVGVTDPLPGSTIPLALVRLADANNFTGVIGVVAGRMVLSPSSSPEVETDTEHPDGDSPQTEEPPDFRSVDGPAEAGDYVALTVFGVDKVKVDPTANIQPGQRLTASETAGQARALRSEMLNGMVVTEGAPVIGIALAASELDSDTIPIFVTLR